MGRKATSIQEQIDLLKKRGLNIDYPQDKCVELLLDIGYYRLGFYWHHFEIDNEHNFKPGVNLSDVLILHYLDVDLRRCISRWLNRIEVNFRTQLIYIVSNKHKANPFWFADPSIVGSYFIDNLPKRHYTDRFIKNNKTIKRHHANYLNDKYAPAWKTLEFMTFGFNLSLFNSIRDSSTKQTIADHYGIKKLRKFYNHFKTLVWVRNICAHGGTLYDSKTPTGITLIPTLGIDSKDSHSLDAVIKLVAYYLGTISLARKQEFNEDVKKLFENINFSGVIKDIIGTKIGYTYV